MHELLLVVDWKYTTLGRENPSLPAATGSKSSNTVQPACQPNLCSSRHQAAGMVLNAMLIIEISSNEKWRTRLNHV